ncbi:MAG: ABC transporter substrate-binding protein [Candidatus Binatia bacterium]
MLKFTFPALALLASLAVVLRAPATSVAATVGEVVKAVRSLPPAQRKAFLEDGARKEGQLIWYTSMSLSDYPKVAGLFEKAYPFIKTNTYRATPSGLFTRIDTEAKAGRFAVDVVSSASVQMWQLKQSRYSIGYLSPELKGFPAGSFDPDGFWSSYEVTPIILAYNPKLVAPSEVPKSYADLLDPKWSGKMSLGTDEYEWFSVLLDGMGKAKATEFIKALARQKLHMPGSSSVMRVQLLMAGENAIAIAARGRRVAEFKEKGAPIDYRIVDPYGGEPNSLALMRRGSHPHASLLFIDWLLSEEIQTFIAQQIPRMSLRKGVKQLPRNQALFAKEFVFVNPATIGSNLNEIIATYRETFGLARAR